MYFISFVSPDRNISGCCKTLCLISFHRRFDRLVELNAPGFKICIPNLYMRMEEAFTYVPRDIYLMPKLGT